MTATDSDDLIRRGPTYVLSWAKDMEKHSWAEYEHNWWLGLAESASTKATYRSDLAWAKVAIFIYDRLGKDDPPYSAGSGLSAMYLRAFMISELGAKPGDDVRDVDRIVRWFYEHTEPSVDEALAKAGHPLQEIGLDDLRELRSVKDRLGVIEVLVKNGNLSPDKDLSRWLEIRRKLP